ncbi:hypothetical protein FAIPA1_70195 [Frankia sp. AiPs1]|uniref:WD40 repeat domain-containing protein n=1 Tax=Frankia sp. AiPa1 TaxID=573492 RepID=UPI00202B1471|nr:WD40 repeat domain-containing protein [Frankia sp. AiPa1]
MASDERRDFLGPDDPGIDRFDPGLPRFPRPVPRPDGAADAFPSTDPVPLRVALWPRRTLVGHRNWVNGVACAPDGRWAVSASHDGTTRRWNLADGRSTVLAGDPERPAPGSERFFGCAVSPDGTMVAVAGGRDERRVQVTPLRSVGPSFTLAPEGPTGAVFGITFSPDGSLLASGHLDHRVRLWSVADRGLLRVFHGRHGHTGIVRACAFSPDGDLVASAGLDRTVRIWRTAGRARPVILDHDGSVVAIAFSPRARTVASGTENGAIILHDADTGQRHAALHTGGGAILSMAYSADGQLLAAGSHDGTITIWDDRSGAELARIRPHREHVTGVAFSRSGNVLVSGSWDRTVQIHEVHQHQRQDGNR